MRKIKNIVAITLLVAMGIVVCAGCGKKEDEKIKVAGLKGPTTMGMAKMMADDAASENPQYEFSVATTADEITPKLLRGEIDMAAIPSNLAAVLCQKSAGDIQVLSINTLGVVYIATNDKTVTSVADLAGREIFATGKGAVPEYILRYVLESNGLNPDKDVIITWKNEPTEVVSIMQEKENAYEKAIVMLPQPFLTVALENTFNYEMVVDLTMAWLEKSGGSVPVTGVLVGNKDFIKSNKKEVKDFLKKYQTTIDFANTYPDGVGEAVESFGIVNADISTKAIPYCKLEYIDGENMKLMLENFYAELYDMNPDSVGGALPDEKFYYIEK